MKPRKAKNRTKIKINKTLKLKNMVLKNLYIRFSVFFLFTFVILLIMNVYIVNTEIINPHSLIDAITKSIYIAIIFPSSLFLVEVKKRDSNTEFKKSRNIFLISIFLFIWMVAIIPLIIKNQLMGIEINWLKSFFASFALALFGVLMIYLLNFVLNGNKNKK